MRTIISALTVMLVTGCALQYVPKPSQEELIVVPVFKPGRPVAIVNKTASREVRIPVSPYDLEVDFRKYAEIAIQLMHKELERRGGVVQSTSSREISLDLADMRIVPGFGRFRCIMNATVATRDGYVRGFEASSVSWNYETAIDGAIVETVKAILTNEQVRQYLGE